jgi:GTPase involved in cell partitioning and DNA repair
MSSGGKKDGKARFHRHKKTSGPPKGGDGQGDFKGGAMTQYRTQPLVSSPCIRCS